MSAAARGERTKALLLCAGVGSRLRPITDTMPKCLVDIAGRPLLEYWFAALGAAGVRDVLVNTHHLADVVRRFLRAKNADGFRAVETFEPELLGSAGTIAAHPAWADDADDILVVYADNLSDARFTDLLAAHRAQPAPLTMLLFHAPNPKACGIAQLDAQGRVIAFEEKPAAPRSDLANGGIYVLTAQAWREIAAMRAFDLGYDVLPRFAGRMRGFVHAGYHRDIGDLRSLEAAREAAPRLFGTGALHRTLQR